MSSVNHDSSDIIQLVSFVIGNEEYGVDILLVQEIHRILPITSVPNAPNYVEGVINLRGQVIPIIDLRKRMGMENKERDRNTRIIVVEINHITAGFIVDAVKEVIRLPSGVTEKPPEITSSGNTEFIEAVGKLEDRMLLLVDIRKVLAVSAGKSFNEAA